METGGAGESGRSAARPDKRASGAQIQAQLASDAERERRGSAERARYEPV